MLWKFNILIKFKIIFGFFIDKIFSYLLSNSLLTANANRILLYMRLIYVYL